MQYAVAHLEDWERIRRVGRAYDIVPVLVLHPCSLYGRFRSQEDSGREPPVLRANFLLYEDYRRLVREFPRKQPGVVVEDLADALPDQNCYWDGAHVYDESNHRLAKRIAALLIPNVSERFRSR